MDLMRFVKNMESEPIRKGMKTIRQSSEQVIDRMEKDLEALWQAYFGLTAEEAEAFPNMSKGQKMVLMEQKYEEMGYDARLTE